MTTEPTAPMGAYVLLDDEPDEAATTASNDTAGGWWPPIYPLCECGSPTIICQHEQPSEDER